MNASRRLQTLLPLAFPVMALLVFGGWLGTTVSTADDYAFLMNGVAGDYRAYWLEGVRNGRLLYGVIQYLFLRLDSPTDFIFNRALGILFLSLFAWAAYAHFRRTETTFSAFALALALMLLPGMTFSVVLSSIYFYPLAGILSLPAARLVITAGAEPSFPRRAARPLLLAAVLLFAGLMIYQPYTLLFWAWIGYHQLRNIRDLSATRRLFLAALAVTALSLAAAFAVMIGSQALLGVAGRTGLDLGGGNPLLYLLKFVKPVIYALNFYLLRASSMLFSLLSLGVILAGMLLRLAGVPWRQRAVQLAMLLAAPMITLAPNILTGSHYTPYRTQVGVAAAFLLYLFLALKAGLARWGAPRWLPASKVLTALGLAGAALLMRGAHLDYLIRPLTLERALMTAELARLTEQTTRVDIFLPDEGESLSPVFLYEFGRPVSFADYGAAKMARAILLGQGIDPDRLTITTHPGEAPSPPAPDRLVIDMDRLVAGHAASQRVKTDKLTPFLGGLLDWFPPRDPLPAP